MDLNKTNNNVNSQTLLAYNGKLNQIIDSMIKENKIPALEIYTKLDKIDKETTFNDYLFCKILALITINRKHKVNIHQEYLNHLADHWSSLILN